MKILFDLLVIILVTPIAVIWFMFYLFIAPILILIQLVKDNKKVKEERENDNERMENKEVK